MTEKESQERLFEFFLMKHYNFICPNTYVLGHESDLVSVTKSGFIHEIEIKSSRNDLLNELSGRNKIKQRKHKAMANIKSSMTTYTHTHIPNYFWFAFSKKIYKKQEIPIYAGILSIKKDDVKIVKKAIRLHKSKLSIKKMEYISRGLMLRYWRKRLEDFKCLS